MPGSRGGPERFLTTVLMTDIVGSTEHASELGDRAWRDLIAQHHTLVRAALRRHGGRELDTAGDGFFAVFDAPAQAVDCALEIVAEVHELGIEVRVGIHVGEVEQAGKKVGGISVPIASRIMAGAEPGEVLVSSTVRDLATGSGLTFDDRGVRELKGVPGEWHVFAVARVVTDGDEDAQSEARERRAAAVRRAQDRPIWQRRPRLVAAGAVGLAIVLATAGLWIWKPWQSPPLAGVEADSIGVIDPDRNQFTGEIRVGTQPGGIVVDGAYAWVTNTGANSVSQIDVATRDVINRTIPVGRAPKGIAVAHGSAWVANSGERTVSRIDIDSSRVVGAPIEVGNGPTAIVSNGDTLWVANATDSTVVSIDAATGVIGERVGVGAAPIALAVDDAGLWLASEDAASVSHLDPITGVAAKAPIQLSARPTALALDGQAVWVTSVDGTVTRIDRSTGRITASIPVGASLSGIALSGTSIWTGDQNGIVYQIEATNLSSPPQRISTNTAVASMAIVDNDLWFAAQPSAASHRGDTLRIVAMPPEGRTTWSTDPLSVDSHNLALEGDGLVGHRRVGGAAGSALLADLALSVPQPTNGGLAYTFQLRRNLVYSTGVPVLASDFLRAAERSFQVDSGGGAWGNLVFSSVDGAELCGDPIEGTPVDRCDLSAGILPDDSTNTITYKLSQADPDFLYKLAHFVAYPVPEGVPMNELMTGPFPGTGPYMVTSTADRQVRLVRNPHFTVWDAAVRPDGFANEIVLAAAESDEARIAMVESGEADFTPFRGLNRSSAELFARVKAQHASQWHGGSQSTLFVLMNSLLPPFDNKDARQAVNFAIDRESMADLLGGQPDVAITCQLLPPGWPGYQPHCPYTRDPDQGGSWKERDMDAARDLIAKSGTAGASVVVGPTFENFANELDYLGSVLEELGYRVTIDHEAEFEYLIDTWGKGETQITLNGWGADYLAPSTFLGLMKCGGEPTGVANYCDPSDEGFEAAYDHALELQGVDPVAANAEWAVLDRTAADLSVFVPLANAGADFVSERVGNYQFNSMYGVLYDQLWVK